MYRFGIYVLAVLSLSPSLTAQNFAIPTNWRKPTSDLDRGARLDLVSGVLGTILPTFNSSSGSLDGLTFTQTASLLCAMSTGDFINSSTTSRDAVVSSLNTVFTSSPNISTDPALWGLAAIDSYRAYKDPGSLAFAQAMWEQLSKFMITPTQAISGIHPLKTVTFPPTCRGATIAGGVFYLPSSPANTDVNGETVAAFMGLSARLFEATSDAQYQAAAELSAAFIESQLYDGEVILDTITIANCFTNDDIVTYNSGFTIEGLSVLASKNSSWTPFLNSLVATAIPSSAWTNATDGVNFEGPGSATDAETNGFGIALKAILIRGLFEAWSRSQAGSAVADLIASYITVQFNALQDLASTSGSNQYSPRWEGPPPTQFLPWGQLAALDVLNSAMGISAILAKSSLSPTLSSHTPTGSSQAAPTTTSGSKGAGNGQHKPLASAALVGGIIAAFAVLGVIIVLVWLIVRHTRRWRRAEAARRAMQENAVPYPLPPLEIPLTANLMTQVPSPYAFDSSLGDSRASFLQDGKNTTRTVLSYAPEASASTRTLPSSSFAPPPSATLPMRAGIPADSPILPPLSAVSPGVQNRPPSENVDTVPGLIERLNRIMSTLPPGGVEEEDPPQYEV